MATNEPFGFDPDDLDRIFPGMGEQLRGALGQLGRLLNGSGQRAGWSELFDDSGRHPRSSPELDTTGNTGDGVWVIYTANGDGDARFRHLWPQLPQPPEPQPPLPHPDGLSQPPSLPQPPCTTPLEFGSS